MLPSKKSKSFSVDVQDPDPLRIKCDLRERANEEKSERKKRTLSHVPFCSHYEVSTVFGPQGGPHYEEVYYTP